MNRTCWLAAFLFALVATSAISAEKALTDNADPRLDKRITISVAHTKLEDVVKQLFEQSGVEIKAGTGARDWKVRERKVTIEAKDVRLGTVLDQLSKLLGFYVSKSGKKDEWAYTFWQDMKARLLESEMLNAEREALAQRSVAMRQSALDTAADALKLSPEEAMKKKDTDPWLAYLGGTKDGRGYASLLDYLGGNFPIERDLMLRGKKTTFPLENLPPYLQQALDDTRMGGFMAMATDNIPPEAQEMFKGLTAYELTVMPMTGMGGGEQEMSAAGFGGMVMMMAKMPKEFGGGGMDSEFGGGFPMGMFPLSGSDTLMGKICGKMLLSVEDGPKDGDIGSRMSKTAEEMGDPAALIADTMARESPTEKEPPTDPELLKEVELGELPTFSMTQADSDSPKSIGKEVVAISKAIGKPVLLESFIGSMPISLYVKAGKQPLYKILIGAEKAGYTWTFGDGTLRLRPDDWALRRSYEIPESLMARYRDILTRNGEFTLDDLATIVIELTDDQIDNTLAKEPEFLFPLASLRNFGSGGTRELLRLYGSMTGPQKGTLTADAGLGFSQLSGAQWDRLNQIISEELGGVYILDGVIKLTMPGAGEQAAMAGMSRYKFEFAVQVGGEEKPRTFSKTAMTYGKAQLQEMQKNLDAAKKKAEADKAEKDKQSQEAPKTDQ